MRRVLLAMARASRTSLVIGCAGHRRLIEQVGCCELVEPLGVGRVESFESGGDSPPQVGGAGLPVKVGGLYQRVPRAVDAQLKGGHRQCEAIDQRVGIKPTSPAPLSGPWPTTRAICRNAPTQLRCVSGLAAPNAVVRSADISIGHDACLPVAQHLRLGDVCLGPSVTALTVISVCPVRASLTLRLAVAETLVACILIELSHHRARRQSRRLRPAPMALSTVDSVGVSTMVRVMCDRELALMPRGLLHRRTCNTL